MQDQQSRLYIAVSGTLPVGLAAAQAVHAAFAFSHEHPDLVAPWLPDPYLIIVTVPDEVALIALASRAVAEGIPVTTWHEPDLDDETTAIVLAPGKASQRLCANLPLLGRRLEAVA